MIDLHCHLLPGIDDGPDDLPGAIAMARAAVAAGTTTIVTTPHVSSNYPHNSARSIARAVAALREELATAEVDLELFTGAEIALAAAAELPDEELTALRLGGPEGSHLLVECPLSPSAAGFERALDPLRDRGHEILLAHPERCPAFQRDPDAYRRLVEQGMIGQVTAGALVGRFGRVVADVAEQLVRDGLVQVVASDGHSAERRRPSILAELEEAGYGEQADWLGYEVPYAVLTGGVIPVAPAMPRRRSKLGRLLGR